MLPLVFLVSIHYCVSLEARSIPSKRIVSACVPSWSFCAIGLRSKIKQSEASVWAVLRANLVGFPNNRDDTDQQKVKQRDLQRKADFYWNKLLHITMEPLSKIITHIKLTVISGCVNNRLQYRQIDTALTFMPFSTSF
uniref:Secreted protein n=1 Tax=Panagrellus redivivus TaxID=6233 RepID=A0A7E4VGG5_PANRE